ncbi:hypothetical protein [Acinetobacter bereziniae]|uniref:hypothetical protein n=1 Tax=Acinetobacter bereziniae TaxID=106648 RepID=UPI003AF6A5C8
MSYFSIDESIEQIKNPYTKEIFKEVHSSYVIGNYRSTVVMLWSVVITDLVLKLKDLSSIYDDEVAHNLLTYIQKEQEKDPTSSKWELKIVEEFFSKFKFFGTPELEQLQHLQKMRHVCAHPVITDDDLLFMPTKSKVYSLIECSLQSVLIRDALVSNKIIGHILKDLDRIRKTIKDIEGRKKYFKNTYLEIMSDNVLIKFIKTLWEFIFIKSNSEMELNLEINCSILIFLADEKKEVFIEFLKKENRFISQIPPDEIFLERYMQFFMASKFSFSYLDKKSKDFILDLIDTPAFKDFKYIKFKNVVDYFSSFKTGDYKEAPMHYMYIFKEECEEKCIIREYSDFCLKSFFEIEDLNYRVEFYQTVILDLLDSFDIEDLIKIMDNVIIEPPSSKIYKTFGKIIDSVVKINPKFDFSYNSEFYYVNKEYIEKLDVHSLRVLENDLPF